MNATLIATIGTRDLMFQTHNGDWYNIGDDQMRGDIIGEQAEVLADLGQDLLTFRQLTQFLLQHWQTYRDRIRPVILGQLVQTQAEAIERVYLIGTDQPNTIPYRSKDTRYACHLLQAWFQHHYPTISVTWVPLGEDGTNPSDFEAMFLWWQRTWPTLLMENSTAPVWLCIKGGVGQTSEAGRISGLSRYGDRIQFFEFTQTPKENRQGIPSEYRGPFLGTAYLWDRTRQQALQLLTRHDYGGALELLHPHLQADTTGFGAVPTWLQAGMDWNQGQFTTFAQRVKSTLTPTQQRQMHHWGWMAYEQAHLATVRLTQGYTVEAMLLSFRAIEGLLWEWGEHTYGDYITHPRQRQPQLLQGVCDRLPSLRTIFQDRRAGDYRDSINLNGYTQRALLEAAHPALAQNPDLQAFWRDDNRTQRNALSHRLGGLSERELFQAWGSDIRNGADWEGRLRRCLNRITGQSFATLTQASLLPPLRDRLIATLSNYLA